MTQEKLEEARNVYNKINLINYRLDEIDNLKKSAIDGKLPIHETRRISQYIWSDFGAEIINLDSITLDIFEIVEKELKSQLETFEKQFEEL